MIFPSEPEGIRIPVGWVAAVVGGMALAITVLFKWALKLLHKNEGLQKQLLDEKEQKVSILAELKRKADERKRRDDTDRGRERP